MELFCFVSPSSSSSSPTNPIPGPTCLLPPEVEILLQRVRQLREVFRWFAPATSDNQRHLASRKTFEMLPDLV